jgi:hypothetical protein
VSTRRYIIPEGILRGLEIVEDPALPDDVLEVDAPDGRLILRIEGIGLPEPPSSPSSPPVGAPNPNP